VVAPISGTAVFSKKGDELIVSIYGKDGGKKLSVRILHSTFDEKLVGKRMKVNEGDILTGVTIDDISNNKRWKGSTPHIHLEVYELGSGKNGRDRRVNPTPYLHNMHKLGDFIPLSDDLA